MAEPLTIGEVAKRCGVATSALRFYEDRGLIRSLRTSGGHRTYERSVIRRIAFIVFAQRVGLTLAEVGDALGQLPENRVPRRADWAKLSASWTARIDERIRPRAAPGRPDRVHRLRLPLARPVQARQPRRLGRQPGSGTPLPDDVLRGFGAK
jgi:redox-sensitive transcriptional activator SoxR